MSPSRAITRLLFASADPTSKPSKWPRDATAMRDCQGPIKNECSVAITRSLMPQYTYIAANAHCLTHPFVDERLHGFAADKSATRPMQNLSYTGPKAARASTSPPMFCWAALNSSLAWNLAGREPLWLLADAARRDRLWG